ncbi:MAG: hypothetical protein OD918_09670 [Gammaproteobacteria bacterium]
MATSKRGQVPYTETTDAIMKGIQKARSDYIKMAGEVDKDWPEYWVSVYVAKEMWKKFGKNGYVTVESSAKNVLTRTRGRPTSDTRGGLKYDIVLWKRNGDARAIIEIKHQQVNQKIVMDDAKRIVSALEKGTKLEFGAIGYYYDKPGKNTRDTVHKYRERLHEKAEDLVKGTDCRIDDESKSYMPHGDDHCWAAGCIIIKRKLWVRKK